MDRKRYTVLTYIIGDYEAVHEVWEKDPNAEYLLVTDNPAIRSETWDVIYDDALQGLSTFDKCYSIRFDCFRYCHTDICLRIDASVQICRSTKWLIDQFEEGLYNMALMPHPWRSDIREEYAVWVNARGYPKEQAERCMRSMEARGYDFSYRGMFQAGFAIMRRNDLTRRLNNEVLDWLRELGTGGKIERLDQTVFSCVVNMKYSHLKVMPVSEQIFHSEMMMICYHGSEVEISVPPYDLFAPDVKYLFDRPVACLCYMVGGLETRELRRAYSRLVQLGDEIWALQNRETHI